MNKITDEDTIKKLNFHLGEAIDTGYAKLHFNEISNLIDLYKRQQTEIKKLQETLQVTLNNSLAREELFGHIKAEAIKEFTGKYEKVLLSMLTTTTLEKKEVIYSCLDTLEEMVGKE